MLPYRYADIIAATFLNWIHRFDCIWFDEDQRVNIMNTYV